MQVAPVPSAVRVESRGVASLKRVLIVGGGIAGLTLAAMLSGDGLDVDLVELEPEWRVEGAGLSIQPNGLRVLHSVGLRDAAINAGVILHRWVFCAQSGDVLAEIDLERCWRHVGPMIGIARARLHEVSLSGVRDVPYRLGITVVSLDEGDDDVRVDFSDGSERRYELVVGADGIRSVVRDLVFGHARPIFAGQISWRTLAPFTLDGSPSVQFWLGDHCFFGLCSVGDGRTYGFANVSAERAHDPVGGRLDRLRQRFADFGDSVQEFLSRVETDEQIHCSAIEWVEQRVWHSRRVVLIGDAAHASSPMMGQGGSLAMEDAYVLADELRTDKLLAEALESFIRRRASRVGWVQQQSLELARSFNTPPEQRNQVLRERGEAMFRARYEPVMQPL
jgi:2-polyprenyl-6-methoxyphenol hydroxylase-like FAD-dependent oxidoreductase